MKKWILIVLIFSIVTGFSQGKSAKEMWQPLLNQPGLADYFRGMYDKLGIEVEGSGEKFTVIHMGDHFELEEGANSDSVDYYVKINQQNVKNMLSHGSDGKIDDYESYRIMRVFFTPMTRDALQNPTMNKPIQKKLAGIKDIIHIYLESPTNDEYVAHTLLWVDKNWLVVEGIHGEPQRVYHIGPEEAIEYQREQFKAQKKDTKKAWKKFKKFYMDYRERNSVDPN